jgi:hypothetical protein
VWRHSPFSELQAFVKLFKPHRIIPNTLDPGLANLDWIAIDNMFRDSLSSHGKSIVESIWDDVAKNISEADASVQLNSWAELAVEGGKGDVALKNMEGGDEAIGLAARWMTPDERGLKKLRKMREYLPESVKVCLERVISRAEVRVQALVEEQLREESQGRSERSEETDEDYCDDRGNTAHRIFAGSSFIRSDERSPSTPVEEEARFYTPVSSPRRAQNHQRLLTVSPTAPSVIFNQEYADWFTPITPTKERPNPLPKTPEPKKTVNILSPSTNMVNTARRPTASKPVPTATLNPTSRTTLPPDLAPVLSSASASFTSTFSSNSTKRSSGMPPSPGTVSRRDKRRSEREERQRIALKLGRARPDLVSKEFTEKFLAPA